MQITNVVFMHVNFFLLAYGGVEV